MHLTVDSIHQIYIEEHGNPNGVPFLFIHGGPGGNFSKEDLEFFDLSTIRLIIYNQRGSGKSIPAGEIKNNTTEDLIQDILKILSHFKIEKTYLFGGSWGSTLALLFAISHPEKVFAMVLRGVFLGTKEDRSFFEDGDTKNFNPDAWNRYITPVPQDQRDDVSGYYYNQILDKHSPFRHMLSYELALYGLLLSKKFITKKQAIDILGSEDVLDECTIFSHYSINDFFISDQYIINQIEKISHIPIEIVQGAFDLITPPFAAKKLSDAHSNATIILADSGHSAHELETKKHLKMAVNKVYTS